MEQSVSYCYSHIPKENHKLPGRVTETPGADEGKGEEDLRCSRFARAAWGCEKMKRQGWSSSVSWHQGLGCGIYCEET